VQGVVVPMVNNAVEAATAVAAVRFPPLGSRSYGPVRAREVLGSADPEALEDIACMVMIETAEGIENAKAIIRTDGVTGVYIGPSDLALSMGIKPGIFPHDNKMLDFLKFIVEDCREAGKVPGIQAPNGEIAAFYAGLGFDMITIGSDAPFLTAAVRSHLATARGTAARLRSCAGQQLLKLPRWSNEHRGSDGQFSRPTSGLLGLDSLRCPPTRFHHGQRGGRPGKAHASAAGAAVPVHRLAPQPGT